MRNIVNIYSAAGAQQTLGADGVTFTLAAGTYYAELFDDVDDRSVMSIHWSWDANLVATITLEASNRSPRETSSWASSGWAATSATTVSPAASASEVMFFGADYGAARMRAKIVVGTQGALRGVEHSKARGAR